ncbi:Protocadherin Fat 4 [Holothuria leucospilota]|uniref:Protocadherin Fat 4 n=1 Tax=Holothuria leucospilota TaxID=206669 RepID=A0A9Q0YCE7_HOLLE|nr:Protocadherin Fat 4 [Holothuria leucospilota]
MDDGDCDVDHPFEITTLPEGRNNFAITVAEKLDYNEKSQFTLCLVAEDRAGGSDSLKSNVSEILIPIRDVQNEPPVFLNLPYSTFIYENNKVGFPVIHVTAQDGDRGVLQPNKVELTLDSPYFEIDSKGSITANTSFDRENLDENPFRLTVIATEDDDVQPTNQTVSEIPVVITILDEDDNIPEFSNTSIQVEFFENSPEGTRLNLAVTVTDADELTNAAYNLELIQPLDAFALVTETGQGSALVDVQVINSTLLDFEVRQQTNFMIMASSTVNSTLGNKTALEVTVNLINLNDNEPVFSQDGYYGKFAENVAAGYYILTVEYVISVEASDGERIKQTFVTLNCTDVNDNAPVFQRHFDEVFREEFDETIPDEAIIKLTAFDADPTSPNNEVSYFISGRDTEYKFRINDTSGELFFNGSVDYDIGDMAYLLTISARDHGSPPKEGTTTLNVTILDRNDNAPVFDGSLYTFSVREDVKSEYVVGNVTATDEDSGFYGTIDYNIIEGGGGVFYITTSKNVGFIRVGGGLDKETSPEDGYSLNITAQDRGSPPESTTCLVNIAVIDVNDEKPVFDSDQDRKYSVSEGASRGFHVLTLHATDLDGNSNLSYQIRDVMAEDEMGRKVVGEFSSQFSCNENNGTISVNEELNREEVETFSLEVVVRDVNAETEDQTDTATVIITIEDINDSPPVFENITDDLSVVEGSANGTIVTTKIRATDPDKGSNGEVVYSLVDDAGGAFRIEKRTDSWFVEVNYVYLYEQYRKSPHSYHSEECSIAVLEDVLRTNNIDRSLVKFELTRDRLISNIVKLEAQAKHARRKGGNLRVHNEALIDREKNDMLTVTVRASDRGFPVIFTEMDVNIEIEDINDNAPSFERHPYDGTVRENSDIDTPICKVTAVDMDATFGVLNYTIVFGNTDSWFKINSTNGNISVADNGIDREKTDEVTLVVEAVDSGYKRDTTEVC